MEKLHKEKVLRVSEQLKTIYKQKKKVLIYHGTTNSTRKQLFQEGALIDTSDLNNILAVNQKEQYVITEPNVPMDHLIKATLPHKLVPPVVMEFPGITVGGGIQGGAAESSSFKYGMFHHICLEYEMVIGNGDILTVSLNQNADLYWGTACSYGSLGVITQIKIKLIPSKPYIRLIYYPVNSFNEAIQVLKSMVNKKIDFIDAILFSENSGTVIVGFFSDKENIPIVTFCRAKDDWFYTHAEKITNRQKNYEELIPLEDYLFRYNRGAFWVGRYAFKKLNIPFNRLTRFIMNPLMKTRVLYRFLHAINFSQQQIIQDLLLPENNALEFLEFIDATTHIYPIWLLPIICLPADDKLSPGNFETKLMIDVGVWGKAQGTHRQMMDLNRKIEKMLSKLRGRKVLYAHQYYPEEEFWEVYDKKWYQDLRRKYYADHVFPDIYEKTYVKEQYEFSIKKGLWDVIKSPFKLPVS